MAVAVDLVPTTTLLVVEGTESAKLNCSSSSTILSHVMSMLTEVRLLPLVKKALSGLELKSTPPPTHQTTNHSKLPLVLGITLY